MMLLACRVPLLRRQIGRAFHSLKPLTVVLDMDECIIHSRFDDDNEYEKYRQNEGRPAAVGEYPDKFRFNFEDGVGVTVHKRPGLDNFLEHVSGKYDVCVFTAGTQEYADIVLDVLENNERGRFFQKRFFRSHCTLKQGVFLKDLSVVGSDLSRTVLVDNNPVSFLTHPKNGVPVESFYDDESDGTLETLKGLLSLLHQEEDVTVKLHEMFNLENQLDGARQHLKLI